MSVLCVQCSVPGRKYEGCRMRAVNKQPKIGTTDQEKNAAHFYQKSNLECSATAVAKMPKILQKT